MERSQAFHWHSTSDRSMNPRPQGPRSPGAKCVVLLGEPLGDASFIPTYLLCKFAAEHVKVALAGDGSDELFGGYPTLAAHRLIEYYERTIPWFLRAYAVPRLL